VKLFDKIFKSLLTMLGLLLLLALLDAPHSKLCAQETSPSDSLPATDSVRADSLASDSLSSKSDKKSGKSESLDYPVYYHASDSNIMDMQRKLIYLYNDAEVKYSDIQLNADFIRVDLDKKEVLAYGMPDSTGTTVGKPVFKQEDETFEADTIRYNFDSKRGIIKDVTTEMDGSYMHGGLTKRQADKTVHMVDGRFTTCNLEHPHFYFKISKAKVIPNDKIVAGPAFLVLEDIPTPLGIPFGFFPNKKGATSGVLIPEYGEDTRGFYLSDGGYYWAINDYLDLSLTGGIYSKGGWEGRVTTNYRVRYKMSGRLSFHYNKNVFSYPGLDNYETGRLYNFKWNHKQDRKAHPSMNFSARVDLSSSAYDKFNSYAANNRLRNTKQSSINFSKFWPGTPFSFDMSLKHSQNSTDSSMTVELPQMSFNMSRIYPLKRKKASGKERFYEKIGVSYSMQSQNKVTAHEDSIFQTSFDQFHNGIKHSIPVTTSFNILKHLTLSPSFNYNERWYFEETNKYYDENVFNPDDSTYGGVVTEKQTGFVRAWDYRVNASLSTKIYGMWEYKSERIKALRHILTPNITYSYLPDFSDEKFDYYENYISDLRYNPYTGQIDTVRGTYSRFEGGVYGAPPAGGSGSLNFSLGNKLDMKVANPDDTAKNERNVALIESLSISTRYNIVADSMNWSPLSVRGRTRIGKFNITASSSFDPYAYYQDTSDNYYTANQFEFNKTGKLARLTQATVSLDVGFSASGEGSDNTTANDFLYGYPHSYVDFSVPWNVNFGYNLRYSKPYEEKTLTQTVDVRGDFSLTEKWKISFRTGYDFINEAVSYTHIEIHRDLHCWEMSLGFAPIGNNTFYNFQINVKSPMLQDLKLQRRQTWYDNL
jgi:lipopolysaccharide assembly outer membrane protein LptD (OstA)